MRSGIVIALLGLGVAVAPAWADSQSQNPNPSEPTGRYASPPNVDRGASLDDRSTARPGSASSAAAGGSMGAQDELQRSLQRAGFTDIRITAQSYVVRAKAPNGSPLVMMLTPDSIAELVTAPPATTPQTASNPDQAPLSAGANPEGGSGDMGPGSGAGLPPATPPQQGGTNPDGSSGDTGAGSGAPLQH